MWRAVTGKLASKRPARTKPVFKRMGDVPDAGLPGFGRSSLYRARRVRLLGPAAGIARFSTRRPGSPARICPRGRTTSSLEETSSTGGTRRRGQARRQGRSHACSDDLLWLPYALCQYVEAHGRCVVLHEPPRISLAASGEDELALRAARDQREIRAADPHASGPSTSCSRAARGGTVSRSSAAATGTTGSTSSARAAKAKANG
jgi:hypothetical protein